MYRRIPLSVEVKKVMKMLMATLCGLLLAVSGYFFMKTSTDAENGYSLRETQIHQKKLESQNRLLKQQVLEAQAIGNLEKSAVVSEMQAPENPIYIKPKAPLTRRR